VLDDDPATLPAVSPLLPLDDAIASAVERRPELVALRRQYGIDDLNIRVARNSLMPRLDLGLNFSGSGPGGNQIPAESPLGGFTSFIPGGIGDALHQMFRFQSPAYGFSLQMTLPVRSSAAGASLADSMRWRRSRRSTKSGGITASAYKRATWTLLDDMSLVIR
jgi:outer membrane protein TolC